ALMLVGLVLAFATAVVCGIPMALVFYWRNITQWWMYVLGGAACSVPTVVLYAIVGTPAHLVPFGVVPVFGALSWGAFAGMVFWMIGVAGESPVTLTTLFDPVDPGPPKKVK